MGKLVELKGISKIYSKNHVLRDITFTIEESQIIAILGGNGTGKSTILRIIAGLERPSSGHVMYTKQHIRIGYVSDRFPKHLRFTPSEYLFYMGKISGESAEYLKKKIPYLLHRFQLDEVNNHRIAELSKGNIQKVSIIQAMIQKNDLLIMDEPISGLDLQAQEELLKVLKEMKEQGTTVLLTYHETTIFEDIVEKSYCLEGGILSLISSMKREPIKLLEVTQLDYSYVKQWEEVLHMTQIDNKMLLYVHVKHSDTILTRVLTFQGSIETVSTIDLGEFELEKIKEA
ncbi:ABC transporter ATP-binding protein [Bacillus spongiae]|uniref:ABC transporter ATP-binding protein n=1 Tax=Bacillus spongiae TaxID=2683610 RepID=A0ABU8H8X4_9BACI